MNAELGCMMPDAGCQMPDAGCQIPDAGRNLILNAVGYRINRKIHDYFKVLARK
jgi:hypothetical protein